MARVQKGPGEPYIVREDLRKAKKKRTKKRTSMAFFGQLTDPQIVDEMSRHDSKRVDPVGGPTSAAWRPQGHWAFACSTRRSAT